MRTPRNALCSCGSGVKFKKCCGSKLRDRDLLRRESREVFDSLHDQQAIRRLEKNLYGEVRPIVSARIGERRIVAVDNIVHWSTQWKTFIDFLQDYVKRVLTPEWGKNELSKDTADRHPIIQWYVHTCHIQRGQMASANEDGVYRVVPDGIALAYMLLAYDLYTLQHHRTLQDFLVHRLKIKEQFPGARYELLIAATLIRAGFTLSLEDERDPNTVHSEFVATHLQSGYMLDVEAKQRVRPTTDGAEILQSKLGLHRLINKGLKKARERDLVVFVDLDLPPQTPAELLSMHFSEISADAEKALASHPNGSKCAFVAITNCPLHLGDPNGQVPRPWIYTTEPLGANRHKLDDITKEISAAFIQTGNIPSFFPDHHESS